jgi:hypothetical protein
MLSFCLSFTEISSIASDAGALSGCHLRFRSRRIVTHQGSQIQRTLPGVSRFQLRETPTSALQVACLATKKLASSPSKQ